jgi:hypothetical protein
MPDTFYFLLFEFSECAYCFADEVVARCWDISWLTLIFGDLLQRWKAMGRTSKFTWTCVLPF